MVSGMVSGTLAAQIPSFASRDTMKLTVTAIRNAKFKGKPHKLVDGHGLYLFITLTSKLWRYNYTLNGKQKTASYGSFPVVGLAEARAKHLEFRQKLDQNEIPDGKGALNIRLDARKGANMTVNELVQEWFVWKSPSWKPDHARHVMNTLKNNVLAYLGDRPIASITPPLFLATLRKAEERGANETARRSSIWAGMAFRYAITSGWLTTNPAADMYEALAPVKRGHMASILDGTSSLLLWEKRLSDLLKLFNAYHATAVVSTALRVLPYVFVRPIELRTARWDDIDLEVAEWRFLVSKTNTEHLVPLARQVVELLADLRPRTLKTGYVFPSARGAERTMSENAILIAMRSMGIEKSQMTGHGFRSVARTLLAERLKYSDQLIEMQLAHAVRDVHGRAYNRTQWIDERTEMMQAWADYLDGLRARK